MHGLQKASGDLLSEAAWGDGWGALGVVFFFFQMKSTLFFKVFLGLLRFFPSFFAKAILGDFWRFFGPL